MPSTPSALKTLVMLAALALVAGAGLACYGGLSRDAKEPARPVSCDGLTGQAKIDCEEQTAR